MYKSYFSILQKKFMGFGVSAFLFCFYVFCERSFYLLLKVCRLLEAAVDLLGLLVIATNPVILLRQDIAAAVAEEIHATDLHRSELCDITLGLSGTKRRRPCIRRRCCRISASSCLSGLSLSGLSLSSLTLSGLSRSALLSGRGLRRLRPLALRLLSRGGSRRRASARTSLAASLLLSRLALLGRSPALEARQDVAVRDALVIRHLLLLTLGVRDGLHRQLLLEHSAVLLADKALQLAPASNQNRARMLRELDPVVSLLLRSIRVLLLLDLLDLATRLGGDADTALGSHCHESREVSRGDLQRERDVGRGHFKEQIE